MGIFQDYKRALDLRQQAPQMKPELSGTKEPQSPLFNQKRFYQITPRYQEPEQPQVDSSNAIGSLAEMLGPTPAEREAREQAALKHKNKMQMWAGLMDGLRHLGNLYYATKGATPQQFNSPYALIEQNYERDRKRRDDDANYSRQYAQALYRLQQQAKDADRRDMLAKAQAKWYDSREEIARTKAENDRLKAEKYIELQDGRIAKLNAETGQIEELLPLKQEEIRSRIGENNRYTGGSGGNGRGNSTGGNGRGRGAYTDIEYIDEKGRKVKKHIPTTGNNPGKAPADQRQPTRTVTKKKSQKKQGKSNTSRNNGVDTSKLAGFSIHK